MLFSVLALATPPVQSWAVSNALAGKCKAGS